VRSSIAEEIEGVYVYQTRVKEKKVPI